LPRSIRSTAACDFLSAGACYVTDFEWGGFIEALSQKHSDLTVPSRVFQLGKRAAGEPTKFNRSGIELLGVVSAAGLECRKPVAEAGELIRRQLGDGFGDVFDFHAGQYSTAGGLVEPWKGI